MKRKISKIFGVGLALVLVLSLSLVAAAPVAASPDVSDVWVQLDDYSAGVEPVTYSVYFTPGADLAKDVDTITVFFPAGTESISDTVKGNVQVDQDGDAVVYGNTEAAGVEVAGYRIVITTPVDITAGTEVRVEIAGIDNPNIDGTTEDFTLNVYTSQETTQVESSSYTIGATSVLSVSFAVTGADPDVAGEADEYTIEFEATSGLTEGWDTITVIFPPDTTIPTSIAAADTSVTIEDVTAGVTAAWVPKEPAAVSTAPGQRSVTLTIPSDGVGGTDYTVDPNDVLKVVFKVPAGIKNPTLATSSPNDTVNVGEYIGKVYTSQDLGITRDGTGYFIDAALPSALGFKANSATSVILNTASDIITIQSKDQYGNLAAVLSGVDVDVQLSSSSDTGLFQGDENDDETLDEDWTSTNPFAQIAGDGSDYETILKYKDTTVGRATITASFPAHAWTPATWDIEVVAAEVHVVELYDGDTLIKTYDTITAAIGDALAGNTVKVGPGTYVEDISVGKADISLESTDGAATTTIVGTITITDGADNFLLGGASGKGFTLQEVTKLMYLVDIGGTPENVTISYNTFIQGKEGTHAIKTGESITGLTVMRNDFTLPYKYGMGVVFTGITATAIDLTVTYNTFTGGGSTVDNSAMELWNVDISTEDTVISHNTITAMQNGILIGAPSADGLINDSDPGGTLEISDNTFDALKYAIDLVNAKDTSHIHNVVITENTFTSNTIALGINAGAYPKDPDNWQPEDFTVKFNDFSGNTECGVYNDAGSAALLDATHNYWGDDTGPGGVGTGMGDAISTGVGYDPWFVTTVSAGEWATGESSLDARATVGVKVSGATGNDQKIGVARYTENPMATPEFTPLTGGFFDVYVEGTADDTEIGIKFYADGMTAQSKVYVWDFFEEVWTECSDQKYNATRGYIWVKVRGANATVLTVPLISDLAGTPFAISTEEAPPVTLESIDATPASVSLNVDGTQQLIVTAAYSDLSEVVVTATSTYVSVPETVATVSTGGLITAVTEGSATVTVTYLTETDTVSVTVSGVWDPIDAYDDNDNGVIDKTEAVAALWDYFGEVITKGQVIEVLWLYFG